MSFIRPLASQFNALHIPQIQSQDISTPDPVEPPIDHPIESQERAAPSISFSTEQTIALNSLKKFLSNSPSIDSITSYLLKLDDEDYLVASYDLYDLAETNPYELFKSPRLASRYFQQTSSLEPCLKLIFTFLDAKPASSFLRRFLIRYLASCISLVQLHPQEVSQATLDHLKCLIQKTKDQALQYKLKTLLEMIEPIGHTLEVNFTVECKTISWEDRREFAQNDPHPRSAKMKAIEASEMVEGYDYVHGGMRDMIHRRPGPDNFQLVHKHIREYTSGRKHFYFENKSEQPIFSNYKAVMLYIITALK
jgi:hypothetical protein